MVPRLLTPLTLYPSIRYRKATGEVGGPLSLALWQQGLTVSCCGDTGSRNF